MGHVESLPSKSANQYRARDIFAYVGLRYLIDSDASKTNYWAKNNCIQSCMAEVLPSYLKSFHFKDIVNDVITHRIIHLPRPTEALAEAVLISECSKYWNQYASERVYSYYPTDESDKASYFKPYMEGMRRRQEKIEEVCRKFPHGTVVYIDIKQFYPSIKISVARSAWLKFCGSSKIPEEYRNLGAKLIDNYAKVSDTGGIIVGPMFCHFLANLALHSLDIWAEDLNVEYVRYVDDITLVGDADHVSSAITLISDRLNELGLELHSSESPKTISLPTLQWISSANDFVSGVQAAGWMRLIGDIKKYLIFHPDSANQLADALSTADLRIPVMDYAVAVREVSTFEKVRQLGIWGWLRVRAVGVTIDSILHDAEKIRKSFMAETTKFLTEEVSDAFERKRKISKIRYRVGRLIYIGSLEDLKSIVSFEEKWPELAYHWEIAKAIISADCSRVIRFGTNVSQAVAQVFRATMETAVFRHPITTQADVQGLAVFILNGIPLDATVSSPSEPLLRFSRGEIDAELMSSSDGFLQELICLHGGVGNRHRSIIGSAFDVGEEIRLDALDSDYGYYA